METIAASAVETIAASAMDTITMVVLVGLGGGATMAHMRDPRDLLESMCGLDYECDQMKELNGAHQREISAYWSQQYERVGEIDPLDIV